jgi:anti-sigma regulatory factor (Ser/Thr protein kinase)
MDGAGPVERLVLRTPTTFRRRLIAVAALAVVALAAVSGFLAWRQYRDNQHRAVTDLNARVVLVGGIIDTGVAGGISTLQAVADAPSVRAADTALMSRYFKRVKAGGGKLFTGGIGWIDAAGDVGASSSTSTSRGNVADRQYFRQVMATHQPYVSIGLIGRNNGQPLVVVAVPTFDPQGKPSGVVTGAILLKNLGSKVQNDELGFSGLTIVDRDGQLILSGLEPVANRPLLAKIQKLGTGDVKGTEGLAGGSHHIVAFATSKVPGWTIAIDRSESSLYAAGRHSLQLELVSLGGAVLVVLAILALLAKRSRREIETAGEQAQSWSRLARSLAVAATPAEIADTLLDAVQEVFRDAVVVVSVDSETGEEIRATSGLPGWRRVPGDTERLRSIAAVARGGPRTRSLERQGDLRGLYLAFGRTLKALHGLPIPDTSGEPGGGIGLLTARSRLEPVEWELLGAYATQAARSLERAWAFEHEHELAVRLQRSLLPSDLPRAPGITLAGEYLAGGKGIEVGGDWYDAVRRPDGILELCVGDVSGRGVGAATVMGRQRSTFRAYAYDHESPAEILRRMIRHVQEDEMITAACVTIDPIEGVLTYSSAGHPPPLLVDRASGEVIRLDGASAPPLGVADPGDMIEQRVQLPANATLALYTDGLVERRGESIEDGIDVLGRTLAGGAKVSAEGTLTEIAQAIGSPTDDVALLVASVTPASAFGIEVPARSDILPDVRRRLRAWLGRQGFAAAAPEVVLAVSEALNNAIEHAYSGAGGVIDLRMSAEGSLLRIEVTDRGEWRQSMPSDERGRGMMLMNTLMDRVEIVTNGEGTRVILERRGRGEPVIAAAAASTA